MQIQSLLLSSLSMFHDGGGGMALSLLLGGAVLVMADVVAIMVS